MTREEAIEHGKEQLEIFGGEHREFIELAIKALEQEPTNKDLTCAYAKGVYDTREETATILDKIRAEIINVEGDCRLSIDEYPSCKQCTDNVFETIYNILDKYKADRSEEE